MSLLAKIGSWLGVQRSMENPNRPLDPWAEGVNDVLEAGPTSAGVRVGRDKSLTYAAVWRAVNLVSRTVAKLPQGVYRHVGHGKQPDHDHPADFLLRVRPNELMTPFVWKQTRIGHVLLEGNAYSYIFRLANGDPVELLPLDPNRTYPVLEGTKLHYVHELKSGEMRKLRAEDILHLKGYGFDGLVGYSVLRKARESVGLGIGQQAYGSVYFRNAARPNVLLKHPGKLKPEAKVNLRESWERMHAGLDNAHRTAILEEGMDAVAMTINARDSQLIEARQFNLLDVADWFGIPPHKLGASTNVSYKSLEQENQSFLDDAIDPWLVADEEECESKLLSIDQRTRGTHCVLYDRFPLARADLSQRGAYYTQALNNGWMCRDEVRAREGMNPIAGGAGLVYYGPLNMAPLGSGDPDGPEGSAVAPGAELIDVPDVRQQTASDCGPAALTAVCQRFGVGPQTVAEAASSLGTTTTGGTRPGAILDVLSRAGLVTTAAAEMDVVDLVRLFSAGHPVLCPIQAGDPGGTTTGHWVVVIGVGLGQVFVHDPAAGRRMIAERDWLDSWHDADAEGNAYTRYGIAVGEDFPAQPAPESEEETEPDEEDEEEEEEEESEPENEDEE